MGYFTQLGGMLISFVFGLFILAVLLRFLLQLVRANFYNPVAQFLVTVTNPMLKPLRRIIPGLWGIDMASVVLLLALQALEILILNLLAGHTPQPLALAVATIVELIRFTVYVFIIAITIRIILSWINPDTYYYGGQNPVTSILTSLTEPLMRPARRLIPPISGFDISPMIVFLVLAIILYTLKYFFR